MRDLILHPQTKLAVNRFISKPSHAILLEGAEGAGKGALATHITAEILKVDTTKIISYPFFRHLGPNNNAISIDAIRDVQRFMRLKTLGDQLIRRILIIEQADRLTIEAQNALLKLLEEPPMDTIIILTTVSAVTLLPTTRSRVQAIHIKTPSQESLMDYFAAKDFKETAIRKAFYISEGQVGLMHALLVADTSHPLVEHINIAKQLLAGSLFERLQGIDKFTKDKSSTTNLLQALVLVCHAALTQASSKHQTKQLRRWHRSLQKVTQIQRALAANANPKLYLTDLMLNV